MDTRAEQEGQQRGGREPDGTEGGFRVVDRRRIRPEADEGSRGAEGPTPPSGQPPTSAGTAGPGKREQEAPPAEPGAAPRAEARADRERGPLPPPTFATLVNSLALNAVAALGLASDRSTGEGPVAPDLPLARHTIDLLGVLEQKTVGNLSPDEARLLEQTLFELRMLFVRASSRTG